ncbi:hypothetical protein XENTR_v10015553 [Xenopus tropicalis]|nr:hypothetical protein XENTR_v10015553 [Xenopus tropicalis]
MRFSWSCLGLVPRIPCGYLHTYGAVSSTRFGLCVSFCRRHLYSVTLAGAAGLEVGLWASVRLHVGSDVLTKCAAIVTIVTFVLCNDLPHVLLFEIKLKITSGC